jgi:hypothetical protein
MPYSKHAATEAVLAKEFIMGYVVSLFGVGCAIAFASCYNEYIAFFHDVVALVQQVAS